MTSVDAVDERSIGSESGAEGGPPGNRPGSGADLQISRVGNVIVVSTAQVVLPRALSESEQAIAHALLDGQSNAEIARARGTSAKTVANQLHAINRKLGVRSREELLAMLARAPRGQS